MEPTMPLHADAPAHVRRVVRYFETMTPASLDTLRTVYGDDAVFEDPFNRVAGLEAVRRVYAQMFEQLDAPRFMVTHTIGHGEHCMLLWEFSFRRRGRARTWRILGSSHLQFGSDGRVAAHRDYWDAASQLYEHLPLLGVVLRALRRRLAAH